MTIATVTQAKECNEDWPSGYYIRGAITTLVSWMAFLAPFRNRSGRKFCQQKDRLTLF